MTTHEWTTDDIPDQTGRIAVITGANTGLGLETAVALAARGASVVLAVRDLDKGKRAAELVAAASAGARVIVQHLDLSSMASVRTAAGELRDAHERIDLLINNAGVMYTPRITTDDGFDLQFATNHLGPFALTGLLLDRLLDVPGSRIVTVSSVGHRIRAHIDLDDLQHERHYSRVGAYGQSKLANLMFTYELQRRLDVGAATTAALAAHPGGSSTELARNSPAVLRAALKVLEPVLMQSAAMGALPTLRAATDPDAVGAQYYGPDGIFQARGHPVIVQSSAQSHDADIQRRLWAASERLTGVTYPV